MQDKEWPGHIGIYSTKWSSKRKLVKELIKKWLRDSWDIHSIPWTSTCWKQAKEGCRGRDALVCRMFIPSASKYSYQVCFVKWMHWIAKWLSNTFDLNTHQLSVIQIQFSKNPYSVHKSVSYFLRCFQNMSSLVVVSLNPSVSKNGSLQSRFVRRADGKGFVRRNVFRPR